MGGEQSKPSSSTTPKAEQDERRESETFLIEYVSSTDTHSLLHTVFDEPLCAPSCEPDKPECHITTDRLGDGISSSPRCSSVEIRASWEPLLRESLSSSRVSHARRSTSSEFGRATPRPSRPSSDRGSIRGFEFVHRFSTSSSQDSTGDRSYAELAPQSQSTEGCLLPLPEEATTASPHWQAELPLACQVLPPPPHPIPQATGTPPQVGIEQILPLYLQATNKSIAELTYQDSLALSQLLNNPGGLLNQLAQQQTATSQVQEPPLSSHVNPEFYTTLSPADRELLEEYDAPRSDLAESHPQDILDVDVYQTPTTALASSTAPSVAQSHVPEIVEEDAPASPGGDPYLELSEEERRLLEHYQCSQITLPVSLPDPYASLTAEELAILNQRTSPPPTHSDVFHNITDEELAIIGGSPSGNAFFGAAVQAPPSQQQGAFAQEEALYAAFQLLDANSVNPFDNLSPEERAILGEPALNTESNATSDDGTESVSEEERMELPRQEIQFKAGISSFYSPEIQPASVPPPRLSGSNRSSFADEQTHVRPSMDIAGGSFTRAIGVHEAQARNKQSADSCSHYSEASSQNIVPEIPPGFPLTALPPMIPPPPPPEHPIALLNPPKCIPEMDVSKNGNAVDPAVGYHERTEKLNIIRSSFALERRSLEGNEKNRSSQMFFDATDSGKISITTDSLASELYRRYKQLAVLPDDMPFPLTLLCMLWGVMRPIPLTDAEAAAWLMEERSVIRMAAIEDGTMWCMMNVEHTNRLRRETDAEQLSEMHSRLVNLYRQGFHNLALVPDDNYFMQNIAYHLLSSGRLAELGALLCDAIWLETKLRSYGMGPVVSDFRRFFDYKQDPNITLMFRAFQISANGSLDHTSLYILKEQMLGRLMVAAENNPGIKEWYDQGVREWRLAVPYRKSRSMPVHLLAKTPSLEQAGGLQRLILKGHESGIHTVLLAPNNSDVITASADGGIRVWDMEIGDYTTKVEEHEGAVTCLTLSKDGNTLVSGGADGVAIVYELSTGVWRHKLCGHTKRINAVAIDPHCRHVVTSSQDMTTRIWSLSRGTCLHVLSEVAGANGSTWEEWAGHHDMAISPDSRIIATVDAEFRIRIWMMETASLTDTLEGHSDWVVSLSFAGDSGLLLTASHDKTLRLWDLWKGCCEHVFEGHRGRINNLRVTENGSRAVSVSDDAVGIVWNVKERCKVCELVGHSAWINDAVITRDGQRVITVSGDELGIVWDGETGEALRILKGHSGEINSVTVSGKGRFAITASVDMTARVWDLSSPSTHLDDFHNGRVTKILYHPGSTKAVTIGEDKAIMIWELETCRCTHLMQSQSNINFAFLVSDGKQLVTASGDRCLCVWDMDSGECVRRLAAHSGSRVKSIAVSPDGTTAVIVLFDSTVTVWNLESMSIEQQLMKRGDRDGTLVHAAAVNEVVMTADGKKAMTVSKDYTARLWDLDATSKSTVLKGHEDSVDLVALKEDGRQCVTASYDRTTRLWDLTTQECTMVLDHPKDIDYLSVSRNWRRAVTIAGSQTAWLWDISRGRCLGILESQKDHLIGAVFSDDDRFLATYSSNAVVRVWTSSSGKLRAVYLADTSISACQFAGSGDNTILLVGDGNGHVHFLEFPSDELASVQRQKLPQ